MYVNQQSRSHARYDYSPICRRRFAVIGSDSFVAGPIRRRANIKFSVASFHSVLNEDP